MRAPFNCSALQTIATRGGEEDCWLYQSISHRNTSLETIDLCHATAEAGAYSAGKPGFQSSVSFFLWMMGQQEVWLPEESCEPSFMEITLLFCLYGSGLGITASPPPWLWGCSIANTGLLKYPEVQQSCPKPQIGAALVSLQLEMQRGTGDLGFFPPYRVPGQRVCE